MSRLGVALALLGAAGPSLGAEQPAVVAPAQHDLTYLAVDADAVYWTTSEGIVRRAKSGGEASLIAKVNGARALACDDHNLYATTLDGRVIKVAKTGGPPTTLATEQQDPGCIAVDSAAVYWVNGGYTLMRHYTPGEVMKVAKTGGQPVVLAPRQARASGLALDDGNVYFVARGRLRVIKKNGGKPKPLGHVGMEDVWNIASDGEALYVAAARLKPVGGGVMYDGADIVRVAKAGGGSRVLATVKDDVFGVAADASGVYWLTSRRPSYAGAVMRVPLHGGAVETLADPVAFPWGLVLDGKTVYLTSKNNEHREEDQVLALPESAAR